MKMFKPIAKQSLKVNHPINLMCETYNVREQLDETGEIQAVFLEGEAITFNKPTRNRVSYTYDSGVKKYKTLIGKPFLDTHNDSSIRTHPPFGHVEMTEPGINPKNGLPCLNYRVNVDPEEEVFIRKAKRGDIPGVSIQVLVDDVIEKEDSYGTFLEANIREFLELSAVLIPGDGDTSMSLAEKFQKYKEGVISPDGILPQKKILAKEEDGEDEDTPLMPLDPSMSEDEDEDELKPDEFTRLIGKRKTEVAFNGCKCPVCGVQMLKDNYSNGFQLRCYACKYRIIKR